MNDAIEDRIGQSGIAHELVPSVDGKLAGDDQRAAIVAVFDNLQQVAALLGGEWLGSPIIESR